eukprot:CAMPEP_0114637608 /NCGR_PEP_ID=MMETSP0191-20121206/186_1 /TAXON_ID=126664 /ORGANISM="Sorites sp." /LENGTH=205 /DNA_ID=CAMNT_0001849337 /DNA_START=47 /DNA_END=661 /DNA_ORIENTATION=+
MWQEARRRSRSPRGGLNTRRISSALCALGRYPKHQPEGLEVEDGTFELENLMDVWGRRQGLTKEDILDSVNAHMFQDSSTRALRYSVIEKESKIYIRVFPSRSKGDYRRGRQGHRFDREMWRDQKRYSRRHNKWNGNGDDNEITDEEDPSGGMTKTEEPDESPFLNAKMEEGDSGSFPSWAKEEEVEGKPRNGKGGGFTWAKQEW